MKDNVMQLNPTLHCIDCPGFDEIKYEAFKDQIIKAFEESYLCCVELLDEDDEIRIEAKERYEAIQIGHISEHTDIITYHLTVMWEAVCGNLDYYYGVNSEEAMLLRNLMIAESGKDEMYGR